MHALIPQARAAAERGDLTESLRLCEEMLSARRPDFHALMLRADVAKLMGDRATELVYIKKAVQVEPKNARARAHYGVRLNGFGEYRQAVAQLEKAIKLDDGNNKYKLALAIAFEGLGKRDKARRLVDPLARLAPDDPEIASIHLRLLLHDGAVDDAIENGEHLRAAQPEPTLAFRNALKTLGKAYERRGEFDRAFERVAEANTIAREPYRHESLETYVDQIISICTPETLGTMAHATEFNDRPVFLVGMPRVGSTLLDRIIHAHPQAHGAGEIGTLDLVVGSFARRLDAPEGYPSALRTMSVEQVDAYARDYDAMLRRKAPKALRITNKELFNFFYLGLAELAFPHARIIHCTRDPVDTCLSCYMERLSTTVAPYASDLRELGQFYGQYRRLMDHWRQVLTLPMLEVAYEDLIRDQRGVTERTLAFLDLPWDDACLDFHRVDRVEMTLSHEQVRQPLYGTAVGRAERYARHLGPLREALGITS